VRNNIDYRLATLRFDNLRLQVAHLHDAPTMSQTAHESINDRTFTRPIGAKNDDFQCDVLL
jgi:hypothetical protein